MPLVDQADSGSARWCAQGAAWADVVDAAADAKADLIVKGLRGVSDFDTELQMAQMNRHVSGIVTMFLPSASEDGFIASKYIREISKMGGDVTDLVPGPVAVALKEKFGR